MLAKTYAIVEISLPFIAGLRNPTACPSIIINKNKSKAKHVLMIPQFNYFSKAVKSFSPNNQTNAAAVFSEVTCIFVENSINTRK